MSSTNEHLPPPSKPRLSPLEFRNTDLVSRLLAATPPYLYNMSLLPNTYFFSEMLRSFVQAKAERNSAVLHPPMRRSRKRTWSTTRAECYQKSNAETKPEEKIEENPLELTNKPETSEAYHNKMESFTPKVETTVSEQMYRNLHPSLSQEGNSTNLVLPPPPPMWYPPLYPAPPYGIDPLHFFIDLRVSGHIYDGKNQKDSITPPESFLPPSPKEKPQNEQVQIKNESENLNNIFKQPRHSSAFSVPTPSKNKGSPMNLSERETKATKFDVKSMGFDKNTNKTSTNYIMNNITAIYKNVGCDKSENKELYENDDVKEETEEEREKRVKDLRALIGLELVVDYMKQKPDRGPPSDSLSSTDIESVGSPALEVVAVNDEN
ncbi:uncharacterized protein LOC108917835 [Anoplophora glabripennis]|uniref:uncharacterized protein LOC108917835 n=1 Tax=Anoplophora glabripennis TaxID=217634 RepID=UPI0008750F32|nr:uncharacterized protein LOC108917835 [Anoplophora glabripennis]